MRLSPRFKLPCRFAQRAAVCPLIVAPAFRRCKAASAPNVSSGRANMSAARPYTRLPANHFSWPSFLCHAVKSLSAPVCLCSSPFLPLGFSLSRLFPQPAFAKFRRLFIPKVLAAFHWCAAKPLCLPRPFFMRRVLSSKPMPPCFPFSLIGLSQAYPLNHAAFRPLRRRFLFS